MTRLQFRVLYREFLFRMVDLELLSAHAQGDMSKLLGQFAALLVFLSLGFCIPALGLIGSRQPAQGRLIAAWSAEHFLIATTMLVVGLFAVLTWDSTFPDRRDMLVLAPLPVRARTLFLAKVAAVATALGLAVAILHIAAGLVWPLAIHSQDPKQIYPTLTSDPAIPPVDAPNLESVLQRDLADVSKPGSGLLAPGTGAGLAIGVITHGVRRVFTMGAAKPDSLFEIGSVTKTFTGLILAQMAAQGKVTLPQPVRELLPEGTVARPTGGNEITLLDLATQRSGLPRMADNFHPADETNPFADYGTAELYSYLSRRGVRKPPKAEFRYSNLGFGLLGHALANRAGTTWAGLVKELVTAPLGLKDTVVSLSPDQQRRFIHGHNGDHEPVRAFDLDAIAGAGALRSTAGDMLAYLEANLHPERLSQGAGTIAASLRRSHELQADAGPGARIALAWFYDTRAGNYWHGGATAGNTADATFNPRDDYAIIVLSNTGPGTIISADLIGDHIRSRLTGKPAVAVAAVKIPGSGGFWGLLRLYAVYWITMLAAGAFIFCCVLGVQGLAAQLLPRRLFLRASSIMQLAAFSLFVSVYFLQPIAATAGEIMTAQRPGLLVWSPSFWFLGLFQQLNGSSALAPLARRAWIGLAIVVCATAAAYVLCYFRTLRRIVEEPDIVPSVRASARMPRFSDGLKTAVVQFSIRTLVRSRMHRVILTFYLGIGFAITICFIKSPRAQQQLMDASTGDAWGQPNIPLLVSSIMMMACWVVGMRVVFSLPLDLRANWIFRITPLRGGAACLAARRRALYRLAVAPAWLLSAALFFALWPGRAAAGHVLVLGLLGMMLAELCLYGPQKIPFTCSYLPGKSNFHITFWLCVGLLITLIDKAAGWERDALANPTGYLTMIGILGLGTIAARWRASAQAGSEESELRFEEEPAPVILSLDLNRDAV